MTFQGQSLTLAWIKDYLHSIHDLSVMTLFKKNSCAADESLSMRSHTTVLFNPIQGATL